MTQELFSFAAAPSFSLSPPLSEDLPQAAGEKTPHGTRWTGLTEVAEDGNSVTLRRFQGQFTLPDYATTEWVELNRPRLQMGAVVDVETTGLDKKTDEVIELGLRRFLFDRETGDVVSICEAYTALQDPGRPLSEEISELTGLTDAMLSGKSIDWTLADRLLSDVDLIVAHNASFDRPFIDRHCAHSRKKLWGCTFRQLDWQKKGFPSAKLEIVSLYHGFYTAAHRAQNDVDALLLLISMKDRETQQPYLHELYIQADQPYVNVVAAGSPFESKDALKARGYRWNNLGRVWQKLIQSSELTEEVTWLETSVYRGSFRGITEEIPALDNFKE